jgi:hypothetical protein
MVDTRNSVVGKILALPNVGSCNDLMNYTLM